VKRVAGAGMSGSPTSPAPFADHYATLGCSPETPQAELKRAYHELLREYHPDKRPESAGGTGARVTQSLNEAWEVLRDAQKKEAYDATWRREKERAMPAHDRADLHRRRGNELYSKARDLTKDGGNVMNLQAVHQSMKLYKNAMDEYTIAMESAPQDHRLYSNRALCYLAVEDWGKARDDAQYCARLRPDFKKAWLLLTKALWKMGKMEEAGDQLQQGLRYLPGCPELIELQVDFSKEAGDMSFRTASRSVSPVYTPTQSRNNTPSRGATYAGGGPGSRPVSPRLVAAGLAAASGQSPGAQTYAGPSSRSPGPSSNRRGGGGDLKLDGSGTFQTGNFGCATPAFAATSGQKMPPSHESGQASFPAAAHTMWAGNAGNASHRSAYSPGPAAAGSARTPPPPPSARKSSHSPGPAFGGQPNLGESTSRNGSLGPSAKRSTSLRGMMESSTRSRGPTPPPGGGSRGPTPPRR